MTLVQLSYIIAVDRYRHFATAAERSYVTQPTLSMQIHKLEEELGVTIFDRTKSPVIPTEIGKKIIEEAKKILKQSKHIEDLASLTDDGLQGTFRVGIIPTVAPYLLPLFLRSFNENYPNVKLVLEEVVTDELLQLLDRDHLDVGIIATPTEQGHIFEEDLYQEPFLGYISGSHPLAQKQSLSVEDLNIEQIWLLNEGHCFRDQTIELCKKQHREAREQSQIEFESGNLETLKQLVEQDYGMTLLPYLTKYQLSPQQEESYLHHFDDPVPHRKIRIVYSREYLKQNIITAFKEEILKALPDELREYSDGMLVE
jgi:LysR family hydrogen peroxide-inducible transcriptional activator